MSKCSHQMHRYTLTMANPNFPNENGAPLTIFLFLSREQRTGKAYEHPRQMVATACQCFLFTRSSAGHEESDCVYKLKLFKSGSKQSEILRDHSPFVKALNAAAFPKYINPNKAQITVERINELTGIPKRGETTRQYPNPGMPPSREKAQVQRDAAVRAPMVAKAQMPRTGVSGIRCMGEQECRSRSKRVTLRR